MGRFGTLIASPDVEGRHRLRRLIEQEPDLELDGECEEENDTVMAVRTLTPSLLFLDAALPPSDGFGVLERLRTERPPAVVILSASGEEAVRAFELDALDYLQAPFSDGRFHAALDRARRRIREHELERHREELLALLQEPAPPPHEGPHEGAGVHGRLVVKSGSQLIFLDPDDVDWIEAEGVYIQVHAGRTSYLLRESLRKVEERLDPKRFLRIHRSMILNVDRVRKIVPHFNGGAVVVLHDGTQLKMSRSYRDRVSATLG